MRPGHDPIPEKAEPQDLAMDFLGRRSAGRFTLVGSLAGIWVFGILWPVLLVSLAQLKGSGHFNCHIGPLAHDRAGLATPLGDSWIAGAGGLLFIASIFCSPFGVALGSGLFLWMRRQARRGIKALSKFFWEGSLLGAGLAFLNLPSFLCLELLDHSLPQIIRAAQLISLFLLAGGCSGAWISWQAHRATRPGLPFFPPLKLGFLLCLLLGWGLVLLIFFWPGAVQASLPGLPP